MQRLILLLTLTVLAFMFLWSASTVQFVRVQHFCSNAKQWQIISRSPDEHSLHLRSGVYMASSYTFQNGFGLRGVTRTSILVP